MFFSMLNPFSFDPRGRPVGVITIFARSVCPSVRTFQKHKKQVRIVIVTGGNVGLAEWIIDGTHVLTSLDFEICGLLRTG